MKHARTLLAVDACLAAALAGSACGDDDDSPSTAAEPAAAQPDSEARPLDRVVKIGKGRRLYVSCVGRGSPTVVMEAGDADSGDYYSYVASELASTTRACYPAENAGLVLFDTFAPDANPPRQVVVETDPDHPANVEKRDFLQVENDAWDARRRIGDFPMKIVTVDYGSATTYPAERRNVKDERGWLVLSSQAEQVVVDTGHEVVGDDPELAIDLLRDTIKAAR